MTGDFYEDADFEPGLSPHEQGELQALGERLVAERPLPRPAFRGELRRRLAHPPAARGLRLRAVAFVVSGMALLAVASLGALNVGPLAPVSTNSGTTQASLVNR